MTLFLIVHFENGFIASVLLRRCYFMACICFLEAILPHSW